jgi:dTDP-glucose pyrophosphorylase
MINLNAVLVQRTNTIEEVLKNLELSAMQICLVVDDSKRLIGTITDGDIRRGLLSGKKLNDSIESIIFKNPITAIKGESNYELNKLAIKNNLYQIPLINKDKVVIDLFIRDKKLNSKKNKVILMVGGLGSRLRPLTEKTPKPMLQVGNKPILQTTVEGLVGKGFNNIVMCLGYKSEMIKNYFGDGSKFGAIIEYIHEEKRMGTAGSLSLIDSEMNDPFFVMNGDLLTNLNYEEMLNFHNLNNAKATMCVREYEINVPFGVVNTDDKKILSIEEKPDQSFYVNAGIYILEPECIEFIPKNKFYDMPSLFNRLIENGENAISFPSHEYWIDIGRISEYERANNEFENIFL